MKLVLIIIALSAITSASYIDVTDKQSLSKEISHKISEKNSYIKYNKRYDSLLIASQILKQLDTSHVNLDPLNVLEKEKVYIKNMSYISNIESDISDLEKKHRKANTIILILISIFSATVLILTIYILRLKEIEQEKV